jgi:hypothetical protein
MHSNKISNLSVLELAHMLLSLLRDADKSERRHARLALNDIQEAFAKSADGLQPEAVAKVLVSVDRVRKTALGLLILSVATAAVALASMFLMGIETKVDHQALHKDWWTIGFNMTLVLCFMMVGGAGLVLSYIKGVIQHVEWNLSPEYVLRDFLGGLQQFHWLALAGSVEGLKMNNVWDSVVTQELDEMRFVGARTRVLQRLREQVTSLYTQFKETKKRYQETLEIDQAIREWVLMIGATYRAMRQIGLIDMQEFKIYSTTKHANEDPEFLDVVGIILKELTGRAKQEPIQLSGPPTLPQDPPNSNAPIQLDRSKAE